MQSSYTSDLTKIQTQEDTTNDDSSALQVQGLGGDNVPAHLRQSRLEFTLQFFAAHDLGCLRHLSETLFQSAEDANQTAFVDIGHFAA